MRCALPILVLFFAAVAPAAARAEIRLLDPATGAVATPVRDDFTRLLRWTDDGASLLVVRRAKVSRVGVADGSVARVPQLDGAASVGPGGRSVVSTLRGYDVRAADGRPVGSYETMTAFFSLTEPSIAWSLDGSRVAIADAGALLVLDTESGAVVLRRKVAEASLAAAAFAPGASALVVGDGPRVLRIDLPSGGASVLFRAGDADEQPSAAWGASGRIALTLDDRVRVLGVPPADVALRVDSLRTAFWNSDGSALTYIFGIAPDECSYVREGVGLVVPGEPPRALVEPGGAGVHGAAWSPDGRTLAVDLGPDYAAQAEKRGHRRPWPKRIARAYGMFSRRGDAAMRRIVLRASRALRRGAGREETLRRVRKDFGRVARRFREADDTVVREALGDQLDAWLVAAGFATIEAYDEITC